MRVMPALTSACILLSMLAASSGQEVLSVERQAATRLPEVAVSVATAISVPTGVAELPLAARKPLVVEPTPNIRAEIDTRFAGSVNSDSARRPQVQGKYEVLPQPTRCVGVHVIHVVPTSKFLYMERPSDARFRLPQVAGTLDLNTREWVPVDSPDGVFCSGHTITSDGRVVVAGGHKESGGFKDGMRTVRLFAINKNATKLDNVTYMAFKRWYPTVTLLPDQQIMIMGGTPQVGGSSGGNKIYEIFNPQEPSKSPMPAKEVDPEFVATSKKMYYPFVFPLPTGDVFTFTERISRIMVAQTGVYRKNSTGQNIRGPIMPGTEFSQFPFTASVAFTTLTPANNYSSVDIVVFGGATPEAIKNNSALAGRYSKRMTISWTKTGSWWDYSFSDWVVEDMGIPRCMGDATLLPNGDIIILNGAQAGIAGDSADTRGSGGRADKPAFWAQLYQPDLPPYNRYSTLVGSTIARLYHSIAALTTNGTILVAGCDRCFRLSSDVPGWQSPINRWEYRSEVFYPPYWYDFGNKPHITSLNNGITTVGYNQAITLTWNATTPGPLPPVTSAVLMAPSSTTHSYNMNQRRIELRITSIDQSKGVLTMMTPPHPYIAPPQWYMVFINNQKTYSTAGWIQLVDIKGEGKAVPPS